MKLMKTINQAAEVEGELAVRQHKAGNLSNLKLSVIQALSQESKIEFVRSETQVQLAREDFRELLGLQERETDWEIESPLPDLPEIENSLDNLETLALSQRLDISASRMKISSLERALKLAKWEVIPEINLGVESEKEVDITRTGPELGFQIPLFNRGQARRAQIRSQIQKSRFELSALENQIRREVRQARVQLLEARKLAVFYRDTAIPTREKIVSESQLHYNFMLLGPYQLLQAKREELATRKRYYETLEDYWIARSDLERAVGGKL